MKLLHFSNADLLAQCCPSEPLPWEVMEMLYVRAVRCGDHSSRVAVVNEELNLLSDCILIQGENLPHCVQLLARGTSTLGADWIRNPPEMCDVFVTLSHRDGSFNLALPPRPSKSWMA